jgi:hypothetical protein
MSEYNNREGWEASSKTRKYWRFIPMTNSKYEGFEIPPLFKQVNPVIRWLYLGFVAIFILELYATLFVAVGEGVPVEVIMLLLFVDVFFAVLPHMADGKIVELKNFIFIGEYCSNYLTLDDDDIKTYKANFISNQSRLKSLQAIRLILFAPIIISAIVKLILFFGQYPFYDTYQAYIIFVSYLLGCILHIVCTGKVIMYLRFRLSLNRDRKLFGHSNGKINKIENRPDKLVKAKSGLEFKIPDMGLSEQKIILDDNKYYIHYNGMLFDEEINELVGQQDDLKQQFAVALTGKIIQTQLLIGVVNV